MVYTALGMMTLQTVQTRPLVPLFDFPKVQEWRQGVAREWRRCMYMWMMKQ